MEVIGVGKDWLLALFLTFALVFVLYFKPDPDVFVSVVCKGFFGLAIALILINITSQWWRRLRSVQRSRQPPAPAVTSPDSNSTEEDVQPHENNEREREAALEQYQQRARERIQEAHSHKAEEYYERVVRPKEEAQRKKGEDEFYRFAGPAWKGEAQALGASGDGVHDRKTRHSVDGANKDAAGRRHLPESSVKTLRPEQEATVTKRKEKRKVVLGEEPAAGSPGVVTVRLRTPLGRTHSRRFHTSDPMQDVLDLMQTVGYSPQIYQLSSTFPRRCISATSTLTLAEVDITQDVTLNVEEQS